MQPSKDIAALQRRNDELANKVGKLTKQITTMSSSRTSLSNENRSLQERTKSLEETVTQVKLYMHRILPNICTHIATIHAHTEPFTHQSQLQIVIK